MRSVVASVLVLTLVGCASQQQYPVPRDRPDINNAGGNGSGNNATKPVQIATDMDPMERARLTRHYRYQSFQHGCSLEFYRMVESAPENQRWQLRENTLQSGHMGTYRRFASDAAFAQGQHDIPAPLARDLVWFAEQFNSSGLMPFLLVIGHTNSDGASQYNQSLSERRAAEVYEFLIREGVPANRIHRFGVGDTSPLPRISDLQSRYLNRRVELVTFIPSNEHEATANAPCRSLERPAVPVGNKVQR